MPEVTVDDDQLQVSLNHREHLLTLTSTFEVPLSAIADAKVFEEGQHLPWWRVGTHFPGVFRAGRFRGDGLRYFIFHRSGRPAIDITLVDQRFDRLIVDAADPETLVEQLTERKGPAR